METLFLCWGAELLDRRVDDSPMVCFHVCLPVSYEDYPAHDGRPVDARPQHSRDQDVFRGSSSKHQDIGACQALVIDKPPKAASGDPLLQYGVEARVDCGPKDPAAPQEQRWRQLKPERRRQLQSRISQAKLTLKHGISGHRVKQGMQE